MRRPHRRHERPSPSTRLATWIAAVTLLGGCAMPQFTDEPPPTRTVTVRVADEDGNPVVDAAIDLGDHSVRTSRDGTVELDLERPAVFTVSKSDYLDEPVAVSPDDGEITIRLWSRHGPDGTPRSSVHFGGDVMLGRRYLDSNRSTPYVSDEASARRVVAELGAMTAAADTTIVNLETVIGDHDEAAALLAKRFLIQSTPLVTAALDELGVDLVTLGNNHAYDWGEAGLASTLAALDAAGVDHVGAAPDASDAVRGILVHGRGTKIGVVSATTVTGDYVNDQLPEAGAPPPADLAPEDAWQYERRGFGLRAATEDDNDVVDLQIETRDIRIGDAWAIVESAEEHLDSESAATVWKLTLAAFPELQDWVARRDHGGAARYQQDLIDGEIARLHRAGAAFVVVQIHGGYQFAGVESEFIRAASHAAIDAGADAVVSHHPHVLQGVEWYRGKLIAYSLGNLVFDQDFLATFPSALLRVITEGEETVDARLLPLVIDRYRPTPLTGEGARRVVHMVDARSSLTASSQRFGDEIIQAIDDSHTATGGPTTVRFDRNSGAIEQTAAETSEMSFEVGRDGTAGLPECTLVRSDAFDDDVETAVDLFGWGSFDRDTTDARRQFPVGWLVPQSHERWDTVAGPSAEPRDLALELTSDPDMTTTVRIAALMDAPEHRLYAADEPIDDDATYELRLAVRRTRGETPFVRLATYARHDTDPTVDPVTERIEEVELPLDVPDDGAWHSVTVPVPDSLFSRDHGGATALNLIVGLPPAHLGTLAIDDVEVLEWRGPIRAEQPVWMPASRVRAAAGDTVELTMRSC